MSISAFVRGGPAYRIEQPSPWPAWAAIVLAVIIFVAAQLVAAAVYYQLMFDVLGTAGGASGPPPVSPHISDATRMPPIMLLLLVAQTVMVVLTVLASRWGGPARVLRLVWPEGGWRAFVYALLVMIPVIVGFNAFAYLIDPHNLNADFRQFHGIALSEDRLVTTLAIGVGAPLSEELLFRGFVLSALSATRLGFWIAAPLVTLAWTALHWGYSPVGLAEVFVVGIYFSWLLWRTGSLWVPLACHAIYNTALLMVLRALPPS
jgi:membrane protease YdiL (CAAX protease family)